jgi:hypothetical protein
VTLECRLRQRYARGDFDLPFPGGGETALRHRRLLELAREDLPLARLAEAHTDALAILAEAQISPSPGLYGVWAAESPGDELHFQGGVITGRKMFCTGAGLIDHALITVDGHLIEVNLRENAGTFTADSQTWRTCAFRETNTATVQFSGTAAYRLVGAGNWYLTRPGFWHGACGPAACWAGGAAGLFDYAVHQTRSDPHTLAHLGAMGAGLWGMTAHLDCAGNEIDSHPNDSDTARCRALTVRHLIEQACTEILQRLGRAYGPRALAFDAGVSRRYQEVELYIRQSHAERDLEALGTGYLKQGFRMIDFRECPRARG